MKKNESKRINWFTSLIGSAGQWPLAQLKFRPIKTGQSTLNIVLLDTSASTLHNELFAKAKAAILSIAEKAYWSRATINNFGLWQRSRRHPIAYKTCAQGACGSYWTTFPAGGGTPLREVSAACLVVSTKRAQKEPSTCAEHNNYYRWEEHPATFDDIELLGQITLLLDIENSPVKRGKGERIARLLGADYLLLLQLTEN